MSRFETYILEKITRDEKDIALNNKNILVGGEFEFIVNKLQEKIGDNSSEVQDAYYEAENAYEEYINKLSDVRNRISEIELDISNKKDELERKEEHLKFYNKTENPDDYQESVDKIKYLRDKLNILEHDLDKLNDKVDALEPNNEYFDYMKNYLEYSNTELYNQVYGTGVYPRPVVSDDTGVDISDYRDWLEEVEKLSDIWYNAPFKKWNIYNYGEYSPSPGDKEWGITYDSTIAEDGGVEIVSPPLPINEFILMCEKMFKWIEQIGRTNHQCGFHIHMGLKGVKNLENKLDTTKLILFNDEGKIWKYFAERKNNTYTLSSYDNFIKINNDTEEIFDDISKKEIKSKINLTRHLGINFHNISKGHVEFRYIGEEDYHKKWKQVKSIIADYAYNFSLALDPEFKKKDYIKKLMGISNIIEASQELLKQETIKEFFSDNIPNNLMTLGYHKTGQIFISKINEFYKTNYKKQYEQKLKKVKSYISNYEYNRNVLRIISNNSDEIIEKTIYFLIKDLEKNFKINLDSSNSALNKIRMNNNTKITNEVISIMKKSMKSR